MAQVCNLVAFFVVLLSFVDSTLARISDNNNGHIETGCPMEFKGQCKCGYVPYGSSQANTYVTNCTDSDFQTYDMLRELPVETEVLIFTGNELRDLPFNIFGQENSYGKLHTVDLSSNGIQTIKGRTFHNVNNVRKLILNDNDLYIVGKDNHPRMFSNFKNLEELHLKNAFSDKERPAQYLVNLATTFKESELKYLKVLDLSENEISTIPGNDMFCQLSSLEELRLGNNRLHDVNFDLSCMEHLDLLDLHENAIHALRNNSLKRFKDVPGLKLNLSLNPFYCDCNMIDLYEWLQLTILEVTEKDSYHCVHGYPSSNNGKTFSTLTLDDLLCPAEFEPVVTQYYPSTLVIVIIVVILCIIGGVVLFHVRVKIRKITSDLTEPIRSKMQYSSLDKRCDAEMDV